MNKWINNQIEYLCLDEDMNYELNYYKEIYFIYREVNKVET